MRSSDTVAVETERSALPNVQVFYAFNAPSYPTIAAAMSADCAAAAPITDRRIVLFGAPAMGCVRILGDKAAVHVGSLYSRSHQAAEDAPDSFVAVTLNTTIGRLNRDLCALRAITRSIAVCNGPDRAPQRNRARCPPGGPW